MTDEYIQHRLTSNQLKKVFLIRNAIATLHDSPEFQRMDYQPDVTLGDIEHGLEELILECERVEPQKPVMKMSILREFDGVGFLLHTARNLALTSLVIGGLTLCPPLVKLVAHKPKSTPVVVINLDEAARFGQNATIFCGGSAVASCLVALGLHQLRKGE